MGAAVSITRRDLTALELRRAAGGEKDGSAARRMLALALVLDGSGRKTAAATCGMDRQTLRDWVHRYNAEGVAGLRNLKSPGPRPKLTAQQQAELAGLVEAEPDPIGANLGMGGACMSGGGREQPNSATTVNMSMMAVARSTASIPSAPSRSIRNAPSNGDADCATRLGMAIRPMMAA
jgi:hypothetical protein